VPVIRYGVDTEAFSPASRAKRRDSERASLGIEATDFCLLMIGNDWKNKGLGTLLDALSGCPEIGLPLWLGAPMIGVPMTSRFADFIWNPKFDSPDLLRT